MRLTVMMSLAAVGPWTVPSVGTARQLSKVRQNKIFPCIFL